MLLTSENPYDSPSHKTKVREYLRLAARSTGFTETIGLRDVAWELEMTIQTISFAILLIDQPRYRGPHVVVKKTLPRKPEYSPPDWPSSLV